MWRTSPTNWTPVQAPDPIASAEVEIVDAGGDRLGLVLSAWREGKCTAARAIVFDDILGHFAMGEDAYNQLSPDDDFEATHNVFAADLNVEMTSLQSLFPPRKALRQYRILGINMCVETVASAAPTITTHRSYEEARAAATGDRA
jgi:hypothetical protein